MKLINVKEDTVEICFNLEELRVFNNALNEICNGISMPEFEKRIGVNEETASKLLKKIGNTIWFIEDENKKLDDF